IESDFRNFLLFLLPSRLSKDWDSTKDQMDDLRVRLAQETDYELEAANLRKARAVFQEDDRIVVPRVFPQWSTWRVLTMERLRGQHLSEWIATGPSQEERNDVGRLLVRAWYRLMYSARMLYIDMHPGNYLILPDGRLGLLDFGFVLPLEGEEWEWMRRIDRPLTTGRQEDRIPVLKEWSQIRDDETDRLRLSDEWGEWCWMSRYRGGEYDFSDEEEFRRGINLFTEMVRKRYSRARPNTPVIARGQFAWRSILFRLKAKFNIREIAEEEVKATGWDRSEYAE